MDPQLLFLWTNNLGLVVQHNFLKNTQNATVVNKKMIIMICMAERPLSNVEYCPIPLHFQFDLFFILKNCFWTLKHLFHKELVEQVTNRLKKE